MTHKHSPELCHRILRAAVTGEPMTLPECCEADLIDLISEFADDDRVLSAEVVE